MTGFCGDVAKDADVPNPENQLLFGTQYSVGCCGAAHHAAAPENYCGCPAVRGGFSVLTLSEHRVVVSHPHTASVHPGLLSPTFPRHYAIASVAKLHPPLPPEYKRTTG